MSPLQEALSSIRQLSAEEKRRLRDYLDAELASATQSEPTSLPTPTSTTSPKASHFGWARDFLVIREDFDAPLDEFREYM